MDREEIIKGLNKRGYEARGTEILKNGVKLEAIAVKTDTDGIEFIIRIEQIREGISIDDIITGMEEKMKEENIPMILNEEYKGNFLKHIYIGLQRDCAGLESRRSRWEGISEFIFASDTDSKGNRWTAQLKTEAIKMMGVSLEEAWNSALQNTINETRAMSLSDIMNPHIQQPIVENLFHMYILTTVHEYGAGAALNEEIIKSIAKKHNVEYVYMIPASVHEVLIVPVTCGIDIENLSRFVKEVNAEMVDPEEQLSDKAYLIEA